MSKLLVLGEGIDLTAVAAQATQELSASPFTPGMNGIATIDVDGVTGAPSLEIQTSPDNVNWTTVGVAVVAQGPQKRFEFNFDKYIRANNTAAGTAGTGNVYVEAGP